MCKKHNDKEEHLLLDWKMLRIFGKLFSSTSLIQLNTHVWEDSDRLFPVSQKLVSKLTDWGKGSLNLKKMILQ